MSLASVKSRLVLPFWYRLTRVVPEKRPLNGVNVYYYSIHYLGQVGGGPLQFSGHDEHRLQSSQPEVVVVLLRQLFTCQLVQHRHLLGQYLQQQR